MCKTLIIAGIGPGSPDLILPGVIREAKRARVIAGSRRQVDALREAAGEELTPRLIEVGGGVKLSESLDQIGEALKTDGVMVLVSGDPGFYSLAGLLKKNFPEHPIRILPGISSLQYFFSRLGLDYNEARLLSLHGREGDIDSLIEDGVCIACLADARHDTAWVAEHVSKIDPERMIHTGIDLSYPEEKIVSLPAKEAVNCHPEGMFVILVEAAGTHGKEGSDV